MPWQAQKLPDPVLEQFRQFRHLSDKLREEHCMLLLQRVPQYTAGIPATTCRYLQCPNENAVFREGEFILSLESPERCDPSSNSLSYKAVASLSVVLRSKWNHEKGKRGLGGHGEERWHLTCFESLCLNIRKRDLLEHFDEDIPTWAPVMEFGQHVVADERRIPAYPGKFNVEPPYQFGLELWKATQLFDDSQAHGAHFVPSVPPHIHVPNQLIHGNNGQSLYISHAAKDFRGQMPWGEIAEISTAEVRGITLDEMTKRVSAIVMPKYHARKALEKQEEEAKKASTNAESSAASLEKGEIVGGSEKTKNVLAATEHSSTASTTDTEAVAPPTSGASPPETVSVITTGKSHDEFAENS